MVATRFAKIAASGLVMGLSLTGAHKPDSAPAEAATEAKAMHAAAAAAAKASKALDDRNARAAVSHAEAAVAHQPRDPQYRMLLGRAYVSAGRFSSAERAFSDVLTLQPDNARAALNLALAEIALGKRDSARSTLGDYADRLAASDYGLALALAGDNGGAVRTLEAAVRDNGGDAKTRQNLGLAYAMAGRWSNARAMVSQDLVGSAVSDRIAEWAAFVQPASNADQVAALLGVKAMPDDAGQPTRLALAGASGTAFASAAPVEPKPAAVQVAVPAADAPAFEVAAAPARAFVPEETAAPASRAVQAPIIRAETAPLRQMVVATADVMPRSAAPAASVAPKAYRSVESGRFVVQLGAFQNAAVSRDAWSRLSARYALGGFDPANGHVRVRGASFVRLSVGGFATRTEAVGVCTRIREQGGNCFVRGMINDAPAYWVQRGMPKARGAKPVRMAAR